MAAIKSYTDLEQSRDCPFYDGFGQCTQYGNITEEIISKCEFNKE